MTAQERATRDLSPAARAAVNAVGRASAAGFWLGSRVRGRKIFHPDGVVHDATVTITGGPDAPAIPLLSEPRSYRAVVRFSRGVGLPRTLPDVLGVAVRLLDAHGDGRHQDFLLVTSGDGAVFHHLLLPARSFLSLPYSSVLPYRAAGETWLIGARMRRRGRPGPGADEFAELQALAAAGEPAFDLCVAPLGGRLRSVGAVTLGDRLDASADRIRFDPFHSGGGLEPVTFLNRLRAFAYSASERGRESARAAGRR